MDEVLDWLRGNKEWVFSGAGVAAILLLTQLGRAIWQRKRKPKAQPDPQPSLEGWKGVDAQGRYFAWDGPNLHSLSDRSPIPAPQIAIDAISETGATPSFGRQDKLRDHLAKGAMQVYETDRSTWRRELLYGGDGSQVLLVRE